MTTYFDGIPSMIKQTFSRVRRTSGGGVDSYGDATFTETTTTGYKGFFQYGMKEGVVVNIAGRELMYDAIVYTGATTLISESDRIVFGSSTSTAVATRYVVAGILPFYEKGTVDHKEIYVRLEVI